MFLLIGAAVVSIAGSAAAWYFNQRTKEEEEKQAELRQKIKDYNEKFDLNVKEKKENLQETLKNTFFEIKKLYIDTISFYRKEKENVLKDLRKLYSAILEELKKPNISPYEKESLLKERNRVQDALKRLEAYWNYLIWFEKRLQVLTDYEKYENIFELSEPDSILPLNYLYVGKLALIEKEELNRLTIYDQKLQLKTDKVDNIYVDNKQEKINLRYYVDNNIDDIPVFLEYSKDNKYFTVSIAKGEIYKNLLTNNSFDVIVSEKERRGSNSISLDYKGVRGILKTINKIFPTKLYRENEQLAVSIIENDFLLRNIEYSEKSLDETSSGIDGNIVVVFCIEKLQDSLDKLNSSLNNNEISVLNFEYENQTLDLRVGSLTIFCKIEPFKSYLTIEKINEADINDMKIFSVPFRFVFSPEDQFDKNLYLNLEADFINFLNFSNRQTNYQNHSNNEGKDDFRFIEKWNQIIDYQIEKNSYEDHLFLYDEIILCKKRNGLNGNELQIKTSYNKEIIRLINKTISEKRTIVVYINAKLPGTQFFEDVALGNMVDFDKSNSTIIINSDQFPDDLIKSDNKKFILRVKSYPGALKKQKDALNDFNQGKIVNKELKQMLISPKLIEKAVDTQWEDLLKHLKLRNIDLTENQHSIVNQILQEKNIFVLQGPPGTGKTTIIKELAFQFLEHFPYSKLLIVSQQNVAVDNALERIYSDNRIWFDQHEKSMIRIAPDPDKVSNELKKITIENWFASYKKNLFSSYPELVYRKEELEKYMKEWEFLINKDEISEIDKDILEVLISSHNIIGATCVGLANKKIGLNLVEFDMAIIDEAGRATPPELMIPMLRAKKVVLIGDHFQLPPSSDQKLIESIEDGNEDILNNIDREFLETSFFQKIFEDIPMTNKNILTEQFRMPIQVGNLISKLFYENKLKNGIEKKSNGCYFSEKIISWIDVKGKQEKSGTSSYNLEEVKEVVKLIKEIIATLDKKNIGSTKKIAVITPYAAQKQEIKKAVNRIAKQDMTDIKIDTIDSFQGQEAHIVIYSTVKTYGNLSFIIDKRRLNVAISRTQENLIFIGHKNYLKKATVRGKINLFKEINEYIDLCTINIL
jgi:superfamily I DNA and/or RNA helicase